MSKKRQAQKPNSYSFSPNGMPDFIIKEESSNGFPGFINLIGIKSPGLTSCLATAEYVNNSL